MKGVHTPRELDSKHGGVIVSGILFNNHELFGDFVVSSSESDGKVRLCYVLLYLMDVLTLFAHFCFVSGVACTPIAQPFPNVGVEMFCSDLLSGCDGTVTIWCEYLLFYVPSDYVVFYLVNDFLPALCLVICACIVL